MAAVTLYREPQREISELLIKERQQIFRLLFEEDEVLGLGRDEKTGGDGGT